MLVRCNILSDRPATCPSHCDMEKLPPMMGCFKSDSLQACTPHSYYIGSVVDYTCGCKNMALKVKQGRRPHSCLTHQSTAPHPCGVPSSMWSLVQGPIKPWLSRPLKWLRVWMNWSPDHRTPKLWFRPSFIVLYQNITLKVKQGRLHIPNTAPHHAVWGISVSMCASTFQQWELIWLLHMWKSYCAIWKYCNITSPNDAMYGQSPSLRMWMSLCAKWSVGHKLRDWCVCHGLTLHLDAWASICTVHAIKCCWMIGEALQCRLDYTHTLTCLHWLTPF